MKKYGRDHQAIAAEFQSKNHDQIIRKLKIIRYQLEKNKYEVQDKELDYILRSNDKKYCEKLAVDSYNDYDKHIEDKLNESPDVKPLLNSEEIKESDIKIEDKDKNSQDSEISATQWALMDKKQRAKKRWSFIY